MVSNPEAELLARAAAFAATRVAPAAAGWSMGASPDGAIRAEAGRLGLLGIEVPVAQGGAGLGFALRARVCEILAAADFGMAMSLVNTHNVALRLARSAPEGLARRHLPGLLAGRTSACTALTEPGAGSDLGAMTTRAERRGEGWVLSGEKAWIVNARHAGVALVFAQTDPGAGTSGIGAFLVDLDADRVVRRAIDAPFSQSSMGTGGFTLDRIVLPAEHMILPPGTAFRAIMGEINAARTYVAAMCCGMLAAALDTVACHGERRQAFGQPLAAHPAWRLVLAEASTALAAAQALTQVAIAEVAGGGDARLAAAQAKIAAVEAGQRHLPALLHAMGAEGLRPEHCLSRHLAAVQSAALTDGATALLKDQVGRLIRPPTRPVET